MIWKFHNGTEDTGVDQAALKKMLQDICTRKDVKYNEAEVDEYLAKATNNNPPEKMNYQQFKDFFALSLEGKLDLSESLAVHVDQIKN